VRENDPSFQKLGERRLSRNELCLGLSALPTLAWRSRRKIPDASHFVMPAEAGIHDTATHGLPRFAWMAAFAAMTFGHGKMGIIR